MGLGLVIVGLMLVVTGARDTYAQLGAALAKDFSGQTNFLYWVAALLMVGVLGYVPQLRTFSRWFMALIIIAVLLANRGFFGQLSAAIKAGPKNVPAGQGATTGQEAQPGMSTPGSGSGGSSGRPRINVTPSSSSSLGSTIGTLLGGAETAGFLLG